LLLALAGLACLWFFAGRLSMILALATILIYLALYTPLKQISVWCVPIGAISGALPPLIGAVSATGRLEAQGIFLFCVLALWQFPHFFAIAWMYRDDYAKGGFQVLPRNDESGRTTAVIALVGALLLLVICAEYAYLGHASMWFLLVVILPGTLLAGASLDFLLNRSRANARRLFLTSIAYLPVILIATVLL
jgi:protoheme IX farnesyltransferase